MKHVTILDYGMGNIKSIFNAIKTIGMVPKLYSENNNINSNICIIPGVGAFNHAIKLINEKIICLSYWGYIHNIHYLFCKFI